MGGIHIHVAYPQRCVGFSFISVCFCKVMDRRSAPTWEQERCSPVRARGAEDGGGAPGPSTVQGECEPIPKTERKVNFSLAAGRWARRCADPFFLCRIVLAKIKIYECLLGMPSFQCIGGGSAPPPITCRTLGWAARQKTCRLGLAEAPM